MEVKDKDLKRANRKLMREARIERLYGSPIMRKVAENDPMSRPYYDRYKRAKQEGTYSLFFCGLFLLLGVIDIIIILVTQKEGWGIAYAVDFLLSLYWLNDYKIAEQKSDIARHEFVQYADKEAISKAYKDFFGKDDNEKDNEPEKMDK